MSCLIQYYYNGISYNNITTDTIIIIINKIKLNHDDNQWCPLTISEETAEGYSADIILPISKPTYLF